jgi:hypothetical protein
MHYKLGAKKKSKGKMLNYSFDIRLYISINHLYISVLIQEKKQVSLHSQVCNKALIN